MACKPTTRQSRQGFAIGIVLVAIVLGIAVVSAIAVGLGGSSNFRDINTRQLAASSLVNEAETLKSTIEVVENLGYTIANIRLLESGAGCGTTYFCLYNLDNGIDEPFAPANTTNTDTRWALNSNIIIVDNNGTHLGTTAADAIVYLRDVTDTICRHLNNVSNRLEIDSEILMGSNSAITASGGTFEVEDNSDTLTAPPQSGCVADGTLGENVFYYAVEVN